MSQPPPNEPQLTEEQLRQIEAEMERISVEDVLVQTLVTLLNLAARKAGLATRPAARTQPDLEQMRQAIDGARAILPLVEQRHADQLGPVRDALSQLQMAYSQLRGQGGAARSRRRRGRRRRRAGRRRIRRRSSPRARVPRSPPGASGSPASKPAGPPCRLSASERRPLAAAQRVSEASRRACARSSTEIPEGLPCKIS